MTHTIHRYGKTEDLHNDFSIIFISAKGINDQGSQEKIRKFIELCIKHNAVNFGNMEAGSKVVIGEKKVIDAVKDGTTVQAVFSEQEDVIDILSDLVELDLGMSVIVQGLEDKVKECCQKTGLKPHTWNRSLGIWGKRELLPELDVLEITTMCGHGLISVNLVKKLIEDIKKGKSTMVKAIETLSKPCICGMINPLRLEKILKRVCEKNGS